MDIYVVQPGDTIFSIAERFQVPYERLIYDNYISPNYNIAIGQNILISRPAQTYIVQPGDTIQSIADTQGVTILQLLQNNPFLSDRDYLNIGEELIISFEKSAKQIEINAFIFPFIDRDILLKSLPYLTYLTIVGYSVNSQGLIDAPRDNSIIQTAKEYGVAPIMMLSTLTEQGRGSYGITNKFLNDIELQNTLIDNILILLREKELYGINFGFQYILPSDLQHYIQFILNTKERIQAEGYKIFVTLIPKTFGYKTNDNMNNPYFSQVGQAADYVILLSYQWASAYIPTFEQTVVPFIRSYVEYVVTQIPPEKIFISFTRIAYDWELPYVEGDSPVTSLANFDALRLASQIGAEIDFDENYVTPYFYYEKEGIQHFVWFKDARTINAIINMIKEYNLRGISIWNAMDYKPQLWLILNSQVSTPKVLNVTSPLLK